MRFPTTKYRFVDKNHYYAMFTFPDMLERLDMICVIPYTVEGLQKSPREGVLEDG